MSARDQGELAVGGVVVARDRRVLLVRRGKAPSLGEWSIVGGRVEPGEALEAAIAREVLEETSLRVRVVAPIGVVHVAREGYAYAIHEFACVPEDDAAEPRAASDALEVRWAEPRELEGLGLRKDARAVVARALELLPPW
jgi:ADP-ribose pyrophosphatase YjhB (NUDIX family)